MARIYVTHLSHLYKHDIIHGDCKKCYRIRQLDLVALMKKYGDLAINDIKRNLKCDGCGAKGPDDVGILLGHDTGHRGYQGSGLDTRKENGRP